MMTVTQSLPKIESLRDEAHIWFLIPESVRVAATIEYCKSIISPAELEQSQRFHFPEDGHLYLVSHALVRMILSSYVELNPEDWRFERNQHGRPEIANREVIPPLRFNLTHTHGLAACITGLSDACGIDAERLVERHRPFDVARRMFSQAEYTQLERLNRLERLEYFYSRWTLREAYVKALGIGISFPTRKLTFTVDKYSSVEALFHPDIEDQPDNWHFQLLRPTEKHIAAIAIGRNGEFDKKVVTRFIDLQCGKINPVSTGN